MSGSYNIRINLQFSSLNIILYCQDHAQEDLHSKSSQPAKTPTQRAKVLQNEAWRPEHDVDESKQLVRKLQQWEKPALELKHHAELPKSHTEDSMLLAEMLKSKGFDKKEAPKLLNNGATKHVSIEIEVKYMVRVKETKSLATKQPSFVLNTP